MDFEELAAWAAAVEEAAKREREYVEATTESLKNRG